MDVFYIFNMSDRRAIWNAFNNLIVVYGVLLTELTGNKIDDDSIQNLVNILISKIQEKIAVYEDKNKVLNTYTLWVSFKHIRYKYRFTSNK